MSILPEDDPCPIRSYLDFMLAQSFRKSGLTHGGQREVAALAGLPGRHFLQEGAAHSTAPYPRVLRPLWTA